MHLLRISQPAWCTLQRDRLTDSFRSLDCACDNPKVTAGAKPDIPFAVLQGQRAASIRALMERQQFGHYRPRLAETWRAGV
jgi:hypothetical protein